MPPSIEGEDKSGSSRNPYQAPKAGITPAAKGSRAKAPSSAGFRLDCGCGLAVEVSASQAGSTVRCPCGLEVVVPSLGRLRESAGQSRYESGVIDRIHRMIQSGELPSGGLCAVSGKPTDDMIELDLVVPRFFKTEVRDNGFALLMLGGLGAILFALIRRSEMSEEGATNLRVPILVAGRYHAKVRRMGLFRLKRLLRKEPMYAELLEENPHSRIAIRNDRL